MAKKKLTPKNDTGPQGPQGPRGPVPPVRSKPRKNGPKRIK